MQKPTTNVQKGKEIFLMPEICRHWGLHKVDSSGWLKGNAADRSAASAIGSRLPWVPCLPIGQK